MRHLRADYAGIQDASLHIPADEPVFVLRSSDKLAPEIVASWASLVQDEGGSEDLVDAVYAWANVMRKYAADHYDGGKLPDVPDGMLADPEIVTS